MYPNVGVYHDWNNAFWYKAVFDIASYEQTCSWKYSPLVINQFWVFTPRAKDLTFFVSAGWISSMLNYKFAKNLDITAEEPFAWCRLTYTTLEKIKYVCFREYPLLIFCCSSLRSEWEIFLLETGPLGHQTVLPSNLGVTGNLYLTGVSADPDLSLLLLLASHVLWM